MNDDDTDCSKAHPDAPHGFNRNQSNSEHRYVCDCEGWEPEPFDAADLIAGHLACSRGRAYELMRDALNESGYYEVRDAETYAEAMRK